MGKINVLLRKLDTGTLSWENGREIQLSVNSNKNSRLTAYILFPLCCFFSHGRKKKPSKRPLMVKFYFFIESLYLMVNQFMTNNAIKHKIILTFM